MTKALFINGSQRKNGNTAQLLKRAMEGARELGAEVEMVNLYDRSLNYKGCMSCFACKPRQGRYRIGQVTPDFPHRKPKPQESLTILSRATASAGSLTTRL